MNNITQKHSNLLLCSIQLSAQRNICETASFLLLYSAACWYSRLVWRGTMSSSSKSWAFSKLQPAKLLIWFYCGGRNCGGSWQIVFSGSAGGINNLISSSVGIFGVSAIGGWTTDMEHEVMPNFLFVVFVGPSCESCPSECGQPLRHLKHNYRQNIYSQSESKGLLFFSVKSILLQRQAHFFCCRWHGTCYRT